MSDEFTLDDLKRILREGAGEDGDLTGDVAGTEFAELGYESLALLETSGRIEREYGIRLDDDEFLAATTPRALVDLVNANLPAARAV
jgi:act minimal PKS acyl carrier protein